MTIEQILSGESKSNEFTNRFVFKSLKSQATSCFSNITNNFMNRISEVMMNISKGNADCLGYYCSRDNAPVISDELKKDLLLTLKDVVKKEVEDYKKDIDIVFGNKEKVEEPVEKKVEIEVEIPKTPEIPAPAPAAPVLTPTSSFGY